MGSTGPALSPWDALALEGSLALPRPVDLALALLLALGVGLGLGLGLGLGEGWVVAYGGGLAAEITLLASPPPARPGWYVGVGVG